MNKQVISDGVKCCEENNSKSMRHILSAGIAFSRMMIRKDVCEQKSVEKEVWHHIT